MYRQVSLEASKSTTIRLMNLSWAGYMQNALAQIKRISSTQREDNSASILIGRFKRTLPATYNHAVRVARLSHATGRVYGFDHEQLKQLGEAAVLHDIGKIFVPESILNRPCKLTRTERFVMQLHPTFGALLLSHFGFSKELCIRTQHHHERWDGKGYPHKLSGEAIPLMARIVQVADTYDAMVAPRPYRKTGTHDEAIAELRHKRHTQFDARMVEAFLDSFSTRALS